jgi:hypothetical protein
MILTTDQLCPHILVLKDTNLGGGAAAAYIRQNTICLEDFLTTLDGKT